MKRPVTTYEDTDILFGSLMLWGEKDRDDLVTHTREEAFEELFEGMSHVEKMVTDPESLDRLKKAQKLSEEAREFYRVGNYRGGVLTIQEAYEQFMDVRVKSKRRRG